MIKKITKYMKYYFEPCPKKLKKDAWESAQKYFADKPKISGEIISYQQSYKSAYRQTYAKNKMQTI